MEKFDLKDYEKWCKENQKDVGDESSLKEFKESLTKEEKFDSYNVNWLKELIVSIVHLFGKNDEKSREELDKISKSVEDTFETLTKNGNEWMLECLVDVVDECYQKTLIDLWLKVKSALDFSVVLSNIDSKKGEE